jgi:transporter family protein
MSWQVYALLSAVAAGATAVLAKLGVQDIPSNLATAIRTIVILALSWAIVIARGEQHALGTISRRSLMFLVLSGLATYRALQLGPASRVAPIDKLSLAFTVLLAVPVLGEPLTLRLVLGVGLMIAGALLTLR